MINIRGIFRQDKRYCNENDICNINFNSVEEFKSWVHENCYYVADKYIRKFEGLKEDSLEGFLCSDSEYNKCHIKGNACVVIFLITEELAENRILYSNGNHTDGHKHLSERMKEILDEINKNDERSKFNFA